MKILLAEDEEIPALLMRRMLEGMGHEVLVASDGAEAWKILVSESIPLVISDWMMPDVDGPTLCKRIRERHVGTYTYVILLSVRGSRCDRMEGLSAGADDYLVKPVDAEELAVRLEIARRILDVQTRLEVQNRRLMEVATTDELTGLRNRAAFRKALDTAFGLARRQGIPLSLVFLDVDQFKRYNDAYGHPAGDEILKLVASVVKGQVRGHDTVARHGGEEFAVVLLGAAQQNACAVAERIRIALSETAWPRRPVTASLGVAAVTPDIQDTSDLIDRADRALYRSKARGRNCVTSDETGPFHGATRLRLFESSA